MNMGILTWIVVGGVAGLLAKWIMPGRDKGGLIMTVVLGIVGAYVGGWGAQFIPGINASVTGINPITIATATVGALVVLAIYRIASK